MVFSGLKKLKDVENRLYLVLILWVIIGFTMYRFLPPVAAVIIFLPLIGICVVLFLVSIISRKKVNEFSKKRMLIHFILAIPFVVILLYIAVYLFYLALFSYVLITAVFTIYNCYKIGTDIHDKFSKLRSPLNKVFQWGLLVIGVVLSIGIIFGTNFILENVLDYVIDATTFNPYGLAWILTIIIVFFTVIALILASRGSLNS